MAATQETMDYGKDMKAAEVAHIDTSDHAAIKEKEEMAAGHEELEKTLTLWQNLKLYKKVSNHLSREYYVALNEVCVLGGGDECITHHGGVR